jgi:hypothetical protein
MSDRHGASTEDDPKFCPRVVCQFVAQRTALGTVIFQFIHYYAFHFKH